MGESFVAREGFASLTSSSCLPRLLCSIVSSLVERETGERNTRIREYNAARGFQSPWWHAEHAWPPGASTNFLCIGCCDATGSVEGTRRKL